MALFCTEVRQQLTAPARGDRMRAAQIRGRGKAMCVLALALGLSPVWPVVLIGNRDELHARPSAPLHRWPEAPRVLAGKDLQSGGTWLGVSEAGRLAVVTNLRGFGPPQEGRPSRGALVTQALEGAGPWADPDGAELSAFNPLNLIVAEGRKGRFWANRPGLVRRELGPGLYGLSNGDLDEPWPKTRRLKAMLGRWLERPGEPEALFAALADESRPVDAELPATGLELERERLASAIFIRHPLYGTRCSTIVLVGADGAGRIGERRFGADGEAVGETWLDFTGFQVGATAAGAEETLP
jgi:uncharacterized protein with NRDE domain